MPGVMMINRASLRRRDSLNDNCSNDVPGLLNAAAVMIEWQRRFYSLVVELRANTGLDDLSRLPERWKDVCQSTAL